MSFKESYFQQIALAAQQDVKQAPLSPLEKIDVFELEPQQDPTLNEIEIEPTQDKEPQDEQPDAIETKSTEIEQLKKYVNDVDSSVFKIYEQMQDIEKRLLCIENSKFKTHVNEFMHTHNEQMQDIQSVLLDISKRLLHAKL